MRPSTQPRFFSSLRGYAPRRLRGDLIAGLTLWAVLVPQALAYASIAGVSPVVGLYVAPGALLLYAALGSSTVLVVGPMAASAALLTVAGAIAAVNVFGLDVPTVGSIASGLPSLGLPDIDLADAGRLAGGAVGVMLIAFAEGLGAAKAYAGRGGPRVDANRELLALGGANLASGMSSGMVVSGSLSKTAVNASAGARSQATGRPGLTSPSSAARPGPAARTTTSSDIATPAPRTRWLS